MALKNTKRDKTQEKYEEMGFEWAEFYQDRVIMTRHGLFVTIFDDGNAKNGFIRPGDVDLDMT